MAMVIRSIIMAATKNIIMNNHTTWPLSRVLFVYALTICVAISLFLFGLFLIFKKDQNDFALWHIERSLAHVQKAQSGLPKDTAQQHLHAAIHTLNRALRKDPYDPYLWLRLSQIEKSAGLDHSKSEAIAFQLKPALKRRQNMGRQEQ